MIKIFDTTLRDGEQSPGCSMNLEEKLQIARQLDKMGVDIIEAGFACSSKGDFESVSKVAEVVENATVASLSRATKKDIDIAWDAVKHAKHPMIHTFIATSDIHLEYKLKITREECKKMAIEAIKHAKSYCDQVEFSCEDATRTDIDFLIEMVEAAIEAGATNVNIPDTVGYTEPFEYYKMIKALKDNVKGIDDITLAVHCHNDLGMATANSLAGVMAGANQIECTINGIGERAGNTAMEEVVMALETRYDVYKDKTNIKTTEIARASSLVQTITGVKVQPHKAIVGANAFAHESGIHQHGMLANQQTYEIMTPESVGFTKTNLVLGKHSGKHALRDKIEELGYTISDEELNNIFDKFKNLADEKKEIFDEDIEALMIGEMAKVEGGYKLLDYQTTTSEGKDSKTIIKVSKDDEETEVVGSGRGPIDAAFDSLGKLFGGSITLEDFKINSVTKGRDALGETKIIISKDGSKYSGKGLSNDIIKSSIDAYINAVNHMEYFSERRKEII